MKKSNQAITLIALVITIIVLLILVGISIIALDKNNKLIKNSKIAKNKTEYSIALERLNIKINEANIYYEENYGRMCTVDDLADYFGKDDETEIIIIKFYETASLDANLKKPEKISSFLVKDSKYSKYIFKIGNDAKIDAVSYDGGQTFTDAEKFNGDQYDNKIANFKELLLKSGINETYTKQDVADNKNDCLKKILENKNSVQYIFENPEEYADIFTSSNQAITLLGQNKEFRRKVVDSTEWCEKIANSKYEKNFSKYFIYKKDELMGTAGGRTYNKRNKGFAISFAFYGVNINNSPYNQGVNFAMVAKNSENAKGWCSYSESFEFSESEKAIYQPTIEYNGEKWYCYWVPFGWLGGQGIDSENSCNYIGNWDIKNDAKTGIQSAAEYVLKQYMEE